MNVIMCDDNKKYIELVEKIVKKFMLDNEIEGHINTFNRYNDALDYVKGLSSYEDCLYILDIDLSYDKTGIILGKAIREVDDYQGEMIFVTGYTHQISNIFKYKLKVLDFIDKGYNLEKDLLECLSAYVKIHKKCEEKKTILIKDGIKTYYLDANEIIFVETDKSAKKIIITCLDKVISSRITLKDFLEIATNDFIQIHRCVVVNKHHIKETREEEGTLYIHLTNNIEQAVSKRREKEIKSCIML